MIIFKENKILEVKNIEKAFVRNQPILKNVSFSACPGEIVALTGKNGSGKSTLLRIIAGLDHSYSGIIKYRGDIYEKPTTNIILLHQSYEQLFPWLTVEQNISFILKLSKKISIRKAEEVTCEVLRVLRIDERLYKRYPHQLSGGQKQKVALARALALNAEILLMDEPFSAIDEESRNDFQMLLKEITTREKKTVILVSHSSAEVNCLTESIITLPNI